MNYEPARQPVRVLVIDDQQLMRQGLCRLLDIEPSIDVVGQAGDAQAAIDLLQRTEADVALVDARMPGMTGIELIDQLGRDHPEIACLVLTTFDDDEFLFGGLRAGARGFLLKDTSPDALVAAIHTAAKGGLVIDGQVSARITDRLTDHTPLKRPTTTGSAPATEVLSARETEIAALVATGASNQEIAEILFIAEGTVKNHISAALRKLQLRDRTQLALHVTGGSGGVPTGTAKAGRRGV